MPRPQIQHKPVLLAEVLKCLQPMEGESYLDLTAGYGGHAAAVARLTHSPANMVLVDRDGTAVRVLRDKFEEARVSHADFLSASRELSTAGEGFDMILADLGVSSPHLENAKRGFSLQLAGPLDMRMDQAQILTAEAIVNHWPRSKIEQILRDFGQEPKAKKIAGMITDARPIHTTDRLAEIVSAAWPKGSHRHPATRTFQALRIAVNDELVQLAESLPLWLKLLRPKGRLAIISFHSLEDRLVKQFLADNSGGYDAELEVLTKKPITPSVNEIDLNPRARSAKLRAACKK